MKSDASWLSHLLILLLIIIILLFLWGIADVLVVAFGAVLFSIFLSWLTDFVGAALNVRRRWCLLLVIILLVLATAAMGWLFGSRISSQASQLAGALESNFTKIRGELQSSRWGQFLLPEFARSMGGIISRATQMLSSGLGLIIDIFLIIFGGIYLAAEPEMYRSGVLMLVPPGYGARAEQLLDAIQDALQKWLMGQLIAMAAVGLLAGVGLWLIGVHLAPTLGLITALAEFMPVVGPIIGAVPAVIVAFGAGPMTAVYAVVLYFGIHQVEADLLTPLIQERMVSLPPALTLFADIVFGLMFGLIGLLLASPITIVIMVAVKVLYVEAVLSRPI